MLKKISYLLPAAGMFFSLSPTLHANSHTQPALDKNQSDWNPAVLFSADISYARAQLPNHLSVNNGSPYLPPYNTDRYTASNQNQTISGAMLGYQWRPNMSWLSAAALAIRYQHFASRLMRGQVIQYSLPEFTNYDYQWQLASNTLGLFSRIDLFHNRHFIPFINLGLGIALNRTSKFNEFVLPNVTPRISPAYPPHTNTTLAYDLGAGLAYRMNQVLEVSISYDYQQLGPFQSGFGAGSWSTTQLRAGRYPVNTARIGLTGYFDSILSRK